MKSNVAYMLVYLGTACCAAQAGDRIDGFSSNSVVVLEARSDFIARVRVVGTEFIGSSAADLGSYGRLTTLQVEKAYLSRLTSSNTPETIYIYREGGGGGSMRDPNLKKGQQCVVFLCEATVPPVATSGVSTTLKLPRADYFSFVALPDRNMPLRKAGIDIGDTNATAVLDGYFGTATRRGQKRGK